MNARQRRRHVRAVRLFPEIHPATRPFVTFAVARWDRARRRTRRHHAGSRSGRHNATLRRRLAVHPNVRVWKEQHRLATYAATAESIYTAVCQPTTPPRMFPSVLPTEITFAADALPPEDPA